MDLSLNTYDGKVNIAIVIIMVMTLLYAAWLGIFVGGFDGSVLDGMYVAGLITFCGSMFSILVYSIAHSLR